MTTFNYPLKTYKINKYDETLHVKFQKIKQRHTMNAIPLVRKIKTEWIVFFKEKYYNEGQKSEENYDPSKQYKATKSEIKNFNKRLQEYEDKIESSYK